MYHTLALTESIATATETDLDPVLDQIIQIQNNHFLPPTDMFLQGAICYGTDLQRAKLETPRLRQISNVFMRPIQPSLVGANDQNVVIYGDRPIMMRGQEEIAVKALQDAGAAQRITVGLFLGPPPVPLPSGQIYEIRGTSTTAAVANTWTQIEYTLDQELPSGTYAVACIKHISTNSQLVRGIFDGQYNRPGAPGLTDVNQRLPYAFVSGYMGTWGNFTTFSKPRIEVLCNGADASHELYFSVIPLTTGPVAG